MAVRYRDTLNTPAYPLWITAPYTGSVVVMVPVYWRAYGPSNFLWFSDLGVFAVLASLWTGNRLFYSMMAVGVLPLELAWISDFVTGGNLTGMAAYMFDPRQPLHLRLISSFHLFVPPLVIVMLVRQGYDRRAFPAQITLGWAVLVASWLLTRPEKNINWVHGLGSGRNARRPLPPLVHLALWMSLLPSAVLLPTHLVLKRLFRP